MVVVVVVEVEEEEEEKGSRVGMPGPVREAILRLFPKPGDWKLQVKV